MGGGITADTAGMLGAGPSINTESDLQLNAGINGRPRIH